MKKKSIVQEDMSTCYFCGMPAEHVHHIFYGTANRKQSEKHKCVAGLCGMCHNLSGQSVHFNKDMDLMLKKDCQRAFEEKIGNRHLFIQTFGRSYL